MPTPQELFESARRHSGTKRFRFESDPQTGFPLAFSGHDRSVRVSLTTELFEVGAHRAVVGWPAVRQAVEVGRALWENTQLDGYTAALDLVCEVCGGTVELSESGDDSSIGSDGWLNGLEQSASGFPPLWVGEHFDFLAGYSDENPVIAVFDAELGYLRDVWLDQTSQHGSSEIHMRVTATPAP